MDSNKAFTRFANVTAKVAGRPGAFVICLGLVAIWAASGPLFGFSDTWQLVINTSTTIVTFLMVFLIQNTQNRDSAALQAKLDELIRISDADNSFIGIEHLTDRELEAILAQCEKDAKVLHEEKRKRGGETTKAPRDMARKAASATTAKAASRPAANRKRPARRKAA